MDHDLFTVWNYLRNLNEKNEDALNIIHENYYSDYEKLFGQIYYCFSQKYKGVEYNLEEKILKLDHTKYHKYDINWNKEYANEIFGYFHKEKRRRIVAHGNYLIGIFSDNYEISTSGIYLKPSFFHFYGNYFDEVFPFQITRIYFNIIPKCRLKWFKYFFKELTNLGVFFQGKFLIKEGIEHRSDNSILYVKSSDMQTISKLISEFSAHNKLIFKTSTPLFTNSIIKGIAIAKNPSKGEESFGSFISKIIAKEIMSKKLLERNYFFFKNTILKNKEIKNFI